ncbi:MAG: hypothetical protein ACRDHF_13965 [Tepidiformaceae bacterium]
MGRTPAVAADPYRIAHVLQYLQREWSQVPDYVRQWPSWDEDKKLDFVLEWDIREDSLAMLRAWAANGDLSPSEAACHREIEELVTTNRPLIQPLLDED